MIGRTVSHYRILSRLGAGGMGVVYLAEDDRLGRQVAVKFLPQMWSEEPTALERFRVEARAASSLSHPGICAVFDIGDDGERPFIVMEALKGETLKDRIAKGPLNVSDVVDIGIQLTDAMDAAHAQNIVHRDIKPANIFIGEKNRVKVLDFGLAKLMATPSRLGSTQNQTLGAPAQSAHEITTPGVALGTIAYMSPEQARGEEIDSRTDLFSLGAVLYEMVTGQQAFGHSVPVAIYNNILNGTPRPISELNPLVPPRLEVVIARALEKDRELRYQHASDLQSEIKRLRRDIESASLVSNYVAVTPERESTPAPAVSLSGASGTAAAPPRSWQRAAAGVTVLAAVAAAAGAWVWRDARRGPEAETAAAPVADERPAAPAESPVAAAPGPAPPPIETRSGLPEALPKPAPAAGTTASSDTRPTTGSGPDVSARPAEPVTPAPTAIAGRTTPPVSQPPASATNELPAPQPPPLAPSSAPEPASAPAPAASTTPEPPIARPARAPEPAAVTPVPASPAETDDAAIRRVIRSYERAIETKDLALYRSVRATLSAAEETTLRNSFEQVDSQEITIRVDSLTIDGRTAVAGLSRQDTLVMRGRRETRSSTQTLRFTKGAAGWVITN